MGKETQQTKEEVIEDIPFNHYRYYGKSRGGGSFFGLIVIFFGMVFLLNNLGIVPWSVWDGLWKFWPLLLVFIGIRMLIGHNWLSRLLFSLITLFVFAGILAYMLYYYGVLKVFGL